MIHPSEHLRNFVARHTANELRAWADLRMSGQDTFPMLYAGKEVERPHEAVAAALGIPHETLTSEKRTAILAALRDIRKKLEDTFLGNGDPSTEKERCDRWAEVVDLARPPELQKEARFLLRAAQEALPQTRSLLPALAAAATAYEERAEVDSALWKGLLQFPETAALAFQRLLRTESFEDIASVWLELFKKKVNEHWPANMRVLTASLLGKKARQKENAVQHLAELLSREGFADAACAELKLSRNADLKKLAGLVKKLAGLVKTSLDEIQSWLFRSVFISQPKRYGRTQVIDALAMLHEAPEKTRSGMRKPAFSTTGNRHGQLKFQIDRSSFKRSKILGYTQTRYERPPAWNTLAQSR